MTTPKIKFNRLSDSSGKKKFSTKQNKYLPDNYYTYDIHRHLETDFHNLNPKKNTHIHICCFTIVESKPNKIITNPFLQYLLYKYPKSQNGLENICVFPFKKYTSGSVNSLGKNMVKSLFGEIFNPIGYIQNIDGIFLFFNIPFNSLIVRNIVYGNKEAYIWTIIDEICNHRKVITFPIHQSVSNIFFSNPKLIYLKDKNKLCIEVPSVAYIGDSQELLNYIATLGIKSSAIREFGPYYYFTDFKQSIRRGAWSTNYEDRVIFNRSIADADGKYLQGGVVRFALFLGNQKIILNRKSDPIFKNVIAYNTLDKNFKKNIKNIKKSKVKWTNTYDSLVISNFKNIKKNGFFWANTGYILKKFNNFTSLSIHLIDKDTLKPNWDMDYELYNIK